MTLDRIKRLGKLWQKRLNLTDWTIQWAMADLIDGESDTYGVALWCAPLREATICIRTDQDGGSHEETIVHELLHIVVEGHTSNGGEDVNVERALNSLAKAFCVAYRRRRTTT